MRWVVVLMIASAFAINWSQKTMAVALCNGYQDKTEEFFARVERELATVAKKDWSWGELDDLAKRLSKFSDGSHRSLPPLKISAIKLELDRLIMWAVYNKFERNWGLGEHAHEKRTEQIIAMALVISKRLDNGDICD